MTQMPVNSPSLPGIRQPLLEGTSASRPYYLFLQWVATNLSAVSATVEELSAQGAGSISHDANVIGQNSIKTRGALSSGIVQVSLQDDVAVAGNTQYYGSDQSGNKGWYAVASALSGSANVVLTTASNGVTTFDLSKPVNSGAGTLQAVTVDAFGRITGTRAATITGTANQIDVANGDASAGPPTLSLDGAVLNQLAALIGSPGLGYIDGLKMVWNSATSLSVTSGAAYIPSLGHVLQSPAMLTLSGLVLTASTWYHVYLYNNAGTPGIECVTTAPDAPYNGTARAKTGDTSRRYLGSVKTDASGNLLSFLVGNAGIVKYKVGVVSAGFRVLSNGTATVATTVSAAIAVPVSARILSARLINTATSGGSFGISTNDGGSTPYLAVAPSDQAYVDVSLNASQEVVYAFSSAPVGGGGYIDIFGYVYER